MLAVIVIMIGGFVVSMAARRLSPTIRVIVAISFVAHMGAAAAQVWIHTGYYEGGDMLTYMRNGALVARLLELDFVRWFPEWGRLVLHMDTELPYVHGTGGSSGTMVGLAALASFVFRKPIPLWESCLLMGVTSTLAQVWMCRAGIAMFDAKAHKPIAIATLLVPSVLFWSSALMKEAVTLPFFALLLLSTVAMVKGNWLRGGLGVAIGAAGVGLVKGYVLMPFILALAAAALVAKQSKSRTRRVARLPYILAGLLIGVLGMAALSVVFPEYSPTTFAGTAAHYENTYGALQEAGLGGTNISLGQRDTTLLGQVRLLPLATINALFRPMFFEARSAVVFVASIETLALIVLLVRVLVTSGVRRPFAAVKSSPALAFCAVFVLTFSVAVGLNTMNLGTLSRYRMPMMPCFALTLLVLGRSQKAAAQVRPTQHLLQRKPRRLLPSPRS